MGLATHHIEKHKWGLSFYRQVRDRLYAQWLRDNQPEDVLCGLCRREENRYLKDQWTRENLEAVSVAFKDEKRHIFDAYMSLDPSRIIVLCNRCHYARERRLAHLPRLKDQVPKA